MINEQKKKEPCQVCKLIRMYIIFAIPLLIVLYLKPEISSLKGILLTDIFATVIGVSLGITVLWKAYKEFWEPHRDRKKKNIP